MLIGAIEAGGTKFVCAIGNEKGEIIERISFPTESPNITLDKCVTFFKDKNISSLGIGSFGPIDLNKNSKTYGYIKNTPKLLWKDFNLLGFFKKYFNIPIFLDTDVNIACLGEYTWGNAKNISDFIYLTIGTGVGGGIISSDKLIHGLAHPEMGHIFIKKHPTDKYIGKCPYHKDFCLEGLASGPAIEERWGKKGVELPFNHPAWDLESFYIAQALVNYILILSPKKIILGGGVMKQRQLFPKIQKQVQYFLNNYGICSNISDDFIVPPKLEDNAGILGAIALTFK